MSNSVILTTPAELQAIVGQAVEAIIPRLDDYRRKVAEPKRSDNLSMVEAVEYLNELGAPATRSSLYNLTFRGQIPHRKIGRRTIFSRKELTAWVESRTRYPEDSKAEAAHRIARSASHSKRR
ncbi:MAG: helix-turn-helix domain-containing protein [Alistipes sp.]|nr:helix-turn-helix domain-containing protein [Alistipes sp.]